MSFFGVIFIFSFLQSFANKMENLWNIIGMHTNMTPHAQQQINVQLSHFVIHSPVLQDGLCLLVYCIPSTNILNVKTVF